MHVARTLSVLFALSSLVACDRAASSVPPLQIGGSQPNAPGTGAKPPGNTSPSPGATTAPGSSSTPTPNPGTTASPIPGASSNPGAPSSPGPTALPTPNASLLGGGKITHVVLAIQENRTFDNLFNGFPGADTVQVGKNHLGVDVALQPVPFEAPPDPSHERSSLLTEYDNGKMDGFDLDPISLTIAGPTASPPPPNFPYAFVPQAETLPYWNLAKTYATADRMFSSQIAPSFPGHQYLIAGQSGRVFDNPANSADPRVNAVWGCDSPAGSTVTQLNASNAPGPTLFPCLDYQTLGDLLDRKNLSWKYYSGLTDGTDLDGQVSAYDAIRHIRYGPDWTRSVPQQRMGETLFFTDLAANALPTVSWVTPPAGSSDHAGSMQSTGPAWIQQIVNAVAASRYASSTAIVVTWDDAGGWYDHVAPPQSGDGLSYGFRVPIIMITPYTKPGYVSHVTHDYGSILHYIESTFGLGTLGTVDAKADDLSDMLDFTRTPVAIRPAAATYSLDRIRAMRINRPVDDDR